MLNLGDEVVDHTLEGIKAERLDNRSSQIRVGVDIVKYSAPIGRFQVFDTTHIQC